MFIFYIFVLFCFFVIHRFSVNRRIFVVGFGLYGSIHGPTDYQVNIQVWSLKPFSLNIFLLVFLLSVNMIIAVAYGPKNLHPLETLWKKRNP